MSSRRVEPEDLITLGTLMRMLGVTRGRAYTISRDKSFPDPWFVDGPVRLWIRAEVEEWIARNRPPADG